MRETFLKELAARGVSVTAAPAEIRGLAKGGEAYHIISVRPMEVFAEEFFIENQLTKCKTCGFVLPYRHEIRPDQWMLSKSMRDRVPGFFAPYQMPGRILASEEMVDAIKELMATGICFEDVGTWI